MVYQGEREPCGVRGGTLVVLFRSVFLTCLHSLGTIVKNVVFHRVVLTVLSSSCLSFALSLATVPTYVLLFELFVLLQWPPGCPAQGGPLLPGPRHCPHLRASPHAYWGQDHQGQGQGGKELYWRARRRACVCCEERTVGPKWRKEGFKKEEDGFRWSKDGFRWSKDGFRWCKDSLDEVRTV